MRKELFFEVLGELDEDIVKGAKAPMKEKMNWKTLRIAAIAAVLAFHRDFGETIWSGL